MRGEHRPTKTLSIPRRGSSPHARGAPLKTEQSNRIVGIIPACAGSTQRPQRLCRIQGDHPRMRGEHVALSVSTTASAGSSPHARGAPRRAGNRVSQLGIIPACAGSTSRSGTWITSTWDHPRMRGEHSCSTWNAPKLAGSSPHARGAHLVRTLHRLVEGIIPACAGSTGGPARGLFLQRDHPRMRGEHLKKWLG